MTARGIGLVLLAMLGGACGGGAATTPDGGGGGGVEVYAVRKDLQKVYAIDLTHGLYLAEVTLPTAPLDVAYDGSGGGSGTVWVVGEGQSLYGLDAQSLAVTSTITVGNAPSRVAAAGDHVWVGEDGATGRPAVVYAVDPAAGTATAATVGIEGDTINDLVATQLWAVALVGNEFAIARVTPTGGLVKAYLEDIPGNYGYGGLAVYQNDKYSYTALALDAYTLQLRTVSLDDLSITASAPISGAPFHTIAFSGKHVFIGYQSPNNLVTSAVDTPATPLATTPLDGTLLQVGLGSGGRVFGLQVGHYGALFEVDPTTGAMTHELQGLFAERMAPR